MLPVLEQLLENQVECFKRDLDGAHKVLVNLNVNLQKQLLGKIKEVIASQPVSVDIDKIVSTIDYVIEEKLSDIKENQEALLSVNLNTQKALKEKLHEISALRGGEGDFSPENAGALIPVVEKLITDKMKEIKFSYEEAQKAMEKLSRREKDELIRKLDQLSESVKSPSEAGDFGNLLTPIRDTLEETQEFLNDFKNNLESIKKNIQLQDPTFFGDKIEKLIKYLEVSSMPEELARKMEYTIDSSLERHRIVLSDISERISQLYEAIEHLEKDHSGEELQKIRRLFSTKMEETREIEKQLVDTFKQMQSSMRKDFSGENISLQGDGYIQEILDKLEETRREQESILVKVDRLSDLVSGGDSRSNEDSMVSEEIRNEVEELRRDNSMLISAVENLKRENFGLQKQVKTSRSFSEGEADAGGVMSEKNRLLDECYREKAELREAFEKEKRDKYEIIQRYETEKKELIDSLALERMQRDKDRAELELLRAEAKKKKWW
jgi:hypothetical protein